MKRLFLLLLTVLSLSAAPSAVVQSEIFMPPSGKHIDSQAKDAGVALAVVGISFMIIDIFVFGLSILGVGGVIFFVFGSVLFFDLDMLRGTSIRSLLIGLSVVAIGFIIVAVRQYLRSKSAKVVTGSEDIIGSFAKVVDVNQEEIHVLCQGEIWNAVSESELVVGEKVRVTKLSGLVLRVKPLKE